MELNILRANVATRAACYRIEKRGNPEHGWGGCWEECCENSGCWRGCCSSFLSKETPLAAPSPALPPAPRIFAALFPAPSPAIFWIAPFLYSVAGRPGRKANVVLQRCPPKEFTLQRRAIHGPMPVKTETFREL